MKTMPPPPATLPWISGWGVDVDAEADREPEPIPDKAARLGALRRMHVPDRAREAEFDRLTRWAVAHFEVPIALVSLVGADRRWFTSACRPDTPWDVAFCDATLRSSRPTVVEDALADRRFRGNPLVQGEPGIRFYAGAPIITPDGVAVGTFCVIDRKPRRFSLTDQFTLRQLAGLVLEELVLRRQPMAP